MLLFFVKQASAETMDLNLRLEPFRAHPLVPGGDLQTIVGYYLPGPKALRPHRLLHVPLPDGDTLVVCENRGSTKTAFPRNVLFMHGLGGDAESPYMLRLAQIFLKRGWRVFRMNHRGAGAGKGLARQLYHSGRSDDISAVLMHLAREYPDECTIAVGFSLSGNALLKLMGEQRHPVPESLIGSVAVSPPIELSRCAAALCRPRNRIYDWRFMKLLKQAIREREEAFAGFPHFSFSWRTTLCEFDEMCTAPLS
ncbi:MAG: alpha/beta fold hydrolase, partial [Calditrichaeota bacterium]